MRKSKNKINVSDSKHNLNKNIIKQHLISATRTIQNTNIWSIIRYDNTQAIGINTSHAKSVIITFS